MNGRTLLVLDPGHGGETTAGASSPNRGTGPNGLTEKTVALELARRTRDRLLSDHTVVLTREDDRNLSLGDRAAAARNLGADMFVSIHLSGAPDPAVDRTDVIVPRTASSRASVLASELQRRIAQVTGASGGVLQADLGQLAGDRHDPKTAACLVEVAAITNPGQAARLADSAYLDRLADAMAEAIRSSANGNVGMPPASPLSYGGRGQGPSYGWSKAIVEPEIDYSTTGLIDTIAIWGRWLARYAQWHKGVPNESLSYFPHAAICQLRLYNSAGDQAWGSGFYIGPETILSCGHNFIDGPWTTTRVLVEPGYSPNMSLFPSKSFSVTAADIVHPRWRASEDDNHDLAVFRVPGLPAQRGWFNLANMSLGPNAGIVVCGYGKLHDAGPFADQAQRMDGAHISNTDFDLVYYPIQTVGGHSGSPVFHEDMVIGVHTGPRMQPDGTRSRHENRGVLLTPDKNDWIIATGGPLH